MTANKFGGKCETCGGQVAARAGTLVKRDGRWIVFHYGPCPPAAPAASVVRHTPTAEQIAAVEAFLTGADLVIEAGAGCTKTSTLVMCAEAVDGTNGRPLRTGQFMAFAKRLTDESKGKFGGNVRVSTIHALAYQAMIAQNPALAARLRGPRQSGMDVARILGLDNLTISYGAETKTFGRDRLASMVIRAVRQFCTTGDAEPALRHIDYIHGIDVPTADGHRTYDNNDRIAAVILPAMRKAWADITAPTGSISWGGNHAYYLKMWERSSPIILADFLMIDEAQDVSGVMLSIVDQQTCQKVLVGDSAQAIFGFLGLVDAMAIYRERGANVARLSKSFRFGDAVADTANALLARLKIDLRLTGHSAVLSTVSPLPDPRCILTRTNAKAVRTVLSALEEGKRPCLIGGATEVVRFAEGALALQSGQPTNHPELAPFATWTAVEQYVIQDEQGDDLRLLVKLITEFGAAEIIAALSRTVSEADADLVVSTAHKSKGCEWDSVQLANDFVAPKDGGDVSPGELRLAYVACTRAKVELDLDNTPHLQIGWEPKNTPEPTALELTAIYG